VKLKNYSENKTWAKGARHFSKETFLSEGNPQNQASCSFSKTFLKEKPKIKPLQFLEDLFEGKHQNQTFTVS
jgi:hypothetical protein